MNFLVLFFVLISGFTGLVYQITWQKYLSIYLGSHALSTTLTLACFFMFLSFGYQFISWYGHRLIKNRILLYGYIEGLIGIYAIFSPFIFNELYDFWPTYPSNSYLHFGSSFGFALLLIGFPTFLMGTTIPLLTQGLSNNLEEGHQIHAWVYGINTFGAFAGSILAGFVLIEQFGLPQVLNITGIVNSILCVFTIFYCKFSKNSFEGYQPPESKAPAKTPMSLLMIGFLSGFISFGLESLLIRMAGITLGSSNYTYTIVVSSFIICIAIGSVLASKSNESNGVKWIITSQSLLVFATFLVGLSIPYWPVFFLRVRTLLSFSEVNFNAFWIFVFLIFFVLLSLPVILLGMTLPLLFQQLKRQGKFLSESAGKMYSYNSWGATLGACILGYLAFLIIDARQVMMVIILASGFSCAAIIYSLNPNVEKWKTLSPLFLSLILALILPKWSDRSFIPSKLMSVTGTPAKIEDYNKLIKSFESKEDEKFLFSNYGVNTYTVVTESPDGNRTVYVNAKPDASTIGDKFTRTLTALIPLTLSKANQDIFIIGLGTGMSSGIAASFEGTEHVKVCEIASGVIQSLPFFEKWNFNLSKNMDKVSIVEDDAYKVLKTEDKQYDLIFSEPSNTWVTGVEKIYTQEFLGAASKRLKKHGLYSQWFPLFSMTEASFLSILYNFKSAFEHVTLWAAGGSAIIIIAGHEPFDLDLERLKTKAQNMASIYKSINREDGVSILYHQLWTDPAVTEAAMATSIEHSLYHPTLSYQSTRAYFINGQVNLEPIANKFFVEPPTKNQNEKPNPLRPFVATGKDRLVWEDFEDQLPKSFFEEGSRFQLRGQSLAAGKLNLVKYQKFPLEYKLEEDLKKSMAASKNKVEQYKYLLDPKTHPIPGVVEEKSTLAHELFSRYIQLKALREKPSFQAVLTNVPSTCPKPITLTPEEIEAKRADPTNVDSIPSDQNICARNKIDIIQFVKPSMTKELEALGKELSKRVPGTDQKVDQLYQYVIKEVQEI